MSNVTSDRFCPICEEIVPIETLGVMVKIFPSRTVCLHPGCAKKVSDAHQSSESEKSTKVKYLSDSKVKKSDIPNIMA